MRQAYRSRFRSVTGLLLTGMWLFTVGMPGAAAADQPFSDRSLRGAYGFTSSGTLFDDPGIAVGRAVFDGDGGCDLVIRVNIAAAGGSGPIVATSCTYAVQPDGTGTLTVALPGLGTFTIAFVMVDNTKELHTISLDPGVGTTALLKRQ